MSHIHERLTSASHDRAGLHRYEPDWLAERWADPETRVLVVGGNRVPAPGGRPGWIAPGEAPDGVRLLLGEHEGRTWFAVLVAAEEAGEDWVSLRGLLPVLTDEPELGSLVLHAIGIAEWQSATHFCSRCGGALSPVAEGHELRCESGHTTFPRTDPAVIMLITSGEPGSPEERCLLGNGAAWPPGRFSTLAGFCEPGESLEDAVRREVAEEVGVRVGEVTYFGNQPWPLPASLMLGFFGRVDDSEAARHITVDPHEIREGRWFTRDELYFGAASGETALPSGISISRSLIEAWYGGPLPGSW